MRSIFIVALALAGTVGAQPLPGTAAGESQNGACASCGVVQSVQYVEKKGEGSGVGLVAGGIVGGVLGHQIGSGRGNTAATIVVPIPAYASEDRAASTISRFAT